MRWLKSLRWAALVVLLVVVVVAAGILSLASPDDKPADLASYSGTVEKGRYLALASNCATCHTAEGGKPYAGGLAFHTPFGALYSTNITTDKKTGIGSWSFEDFWRSMKYGVRPDGAHLYPAYPYTAFAKMTDEDIASIWLYLQTLDPIEAEAPPNDLNFPFNFRPLLAGWKMLFHDPDTFEPIPERSAQWNRGAYLVTGPGHCGACHTPRNLFGAEREHLALTGGVYLDRVTFGGYRNWSAVNLTPAPTGLGAWSKEEIVAYLQYGLTDKAVVHGPMNEVVMYSTSQLTETDLDAMATYLKEIPANVQGPSGPKPSEETLAAGKTVYTVHCGSCHLPTGKGDKVLGVSLVQNPIVQAPDPSSLINVILYGPHLPPAPFVTERTRMKMFGKRLSDEDIANVASFLRSSFENDAGAVTPEQVKVQR